MNTRRAVAVAFERVGLERPAYRVLEWGQSARALPEVFSRSRGEGSDGLPIPPPIFRVQVSGLARADAFLAQSYRAAEAVLGGVRRAGRELQDLDAVLDFGCGCGRVMRRWAGISGPAFHGSDYNPKFIEWCRQNLVFAQFEVNPLAPPLPFEDAQFDLVYALSVFTHFTKPLQGAWLSELRRVIKPGGLLLFTTRGDAWAWKLETEERARYDRGDIVIRYGEVAGTNLCAAFHPWSYVHEMLAAGGFALHSSVPVALPDGGQDMHVAERSD